MASRRRSILLAALLAAFLSAVVALQAQDTQSAPPPPPSDQAQQQPAPESNIRTVRLSSVEGTVQIFSGDQLDFSQAYRNMPIVEGMRIATADDGRAEIELEDGSVVRVAPDSSVAFPQLSRAADGSFTTGIEAVSGLSYYELNGQSAQYRVHFGANAVTPSVNSVFRIDLDNTPAELAVMHGTVHIEEGPSQTADVHTNQTLRCSMEDGGGPFTLVQSIAANSWDQWNSDRDQILAQLDASETLARAGSDNPDDPGWSDLDYYGDWYDIPGYGQAWAPSGVDQNWDPFGVGYWGYYSGVGYTWISGYSWGWWPYHCGAWSWFDGFGWLWFPGNCGWGPRGGGWYPYATVWRVPHGYRPPERPVPILSPRKGPGRIPHPEPLVAVNRGDQFRQGFRTLGAGRPEPRTFGFEGKTIVPIARTIHPQQPGPLGEGFTRTVERAHPEILRNGGSLRNPDVHFPSAYGSHPPEVQPRYPAGAPPRNIEVPGGRNPNSGIAAPHPQPPPAPPRAGGGAAHPAGGPPHR
ncbi:FecR family protein [Paracidobacterium acidisoli]|uniref:FecR protein domain-containing protein n=1 Tax=Paracidobacterium acidisoli TaxID=2303751 RepID=A0A372IQX4_9BACT|nr:FecR family protein [Paracidobacterium acidisoli]MBT9330169.1 FecR family protein [Paracidobacterium acidisoli]